MNFRDFRFQMGLLALAIAFLSTVPAAAAETLPDPLGLRAGCIQKKALPPEELKTLLIADGTALSQALAFMRPAVRATVILTTAACEQDVCDKLSPSGTGVVVSSSGLVLTAFHVIRDTAVIKATFRDVDADGYMVTTARTVRAKVIAVAPDKDVALLQLIEKSDYPHLPIDCRWQALRRSPVWHFGQKSGWGFGQVTLQSTVSIDISGVYETTAQARPGDSGAPFVKTTGELIGILLSRKGDDRSYYMPVADAIAALEKAAAAR